MKVKTLYRYEKENGSVIVTLTKPEEEYTELLRIVADEGKVITRDGEDLYHVIDTDSADGWYEIEEPPEAIEVSEEDSNTE